MKIKIEKTNNTFINNNKKYIIINIILNEINENDNIKIQQLGLYNFLKLICNGFYLLVNKLNNINLYDLDININDNEDKNYLEYFYIPQNEKRKINFNNEFDKYNLINFNSNGIKRIKDIKLNIYLSYPMIIYTIYDKYIFIKQFFNDFFNIFFNELTNILNYNDYNDFYIYLLEEIFDNIKYSSNDNYSIPIKINKNNNITKLLEENNSVCSFSY